MHVPVMRVGPAPGAPLRAWVLGVLTPAVAALACAGDACRPCAARSVARMGTRSTHTGDGCGCMQMRRVGPAPGAPLRALVLGVLTPEVVAVACRCGVSALRRALRCAHWYSEYSHRRWSRLHADAACRACAVRIAYCRCAAQAALVRHSPPSCAAPRECGTACARRRCGVAEPRPRMHRRTTTAARHAPICVTPRRPPTRPRERPRLTLRRWLAMVCSGSRWSSP